MAFGKHTIVDLPFRLLQFAIGVVLIVGGLGFVVLFGLQFPHSSRIDSTWIMGQIHIYQDPMISEVAKWFDSTWPSGSLSFVPLGMALVSWACKILVDLVFLRVRRLLRRLVPAPKSAVALDAAALGLFTGDSGISADSEHAREELLKRYREIESALKTAKRKRCTFLSVDIVGSTQMKIGERDADIAATFQAYEEMLKKIFDQYGAWKQAWTPDGVMICFLQLDLAVGAAQRILHGLKRFNEHDNRLRTPFRVRCGLNVGEVPIFEDSKLEKVADRSIDVAGHMQKQGNVDALWVGQNVMEKLSDSAGFFPTGQEVDGFKVFEWNPEGVPPAQPAPKPQAPAKPKAKEGEAAKDGAHKIGRYEILKELGRGAMGAVYQARDPQIGRIVAIKVIMVGNQPPEVLDEYKQRFYREAQTAGQMSHPGIVTIHDMAESSDGNPYLVMEFVEGRTLDRILAPPKSGQPASTMSLRQKLDIAGQVADALDYAHRRKVIHRDIKPANILVTPEGKAKIADFGIAKMAGTQMTHAGLVVGTPAFMSPEQITGADVDARSDIFSFGVLVYWMLTGKRPFPGEAITQIAYKVVHGSPVPIRELDPDLPDGVEPVIFKCLAKKPEERYQTARDLTADLEALKARQTLAEAKQSSPTAG